MTMDDFCTLFCGESDDPSFSIGNACSTGFQFIMYPSSCINHILIFFVDILLFLMFAFNVVHSISSTRIQIATQFQGFSPLRLFSAVFNGGIGLVYMGLGTWTLRVNLKERHTVLPLNQWLVIWFHGFTWLLLSLTMSLRRIRVPKAFMRLWSIVACLFAGFLFISSISAAILTKEPSVEIVLDVLSLPGAILLLLCNYKGDIPGETTQTVDGVAALDIPLNNEANSSSTIYSDENITPFANAGILGKMSFWWLNPLMKKGKEKTLDEEDVPRLQKEDRAEACYFMFIDKFNRQKDTNHSTTSSILWTIFFCQWKEILTSGFFALLKILASSFSPLLLNAFIEMAEGQEQFRYEGFVLVILLLLAKCIESLAQRQWFFQSRLIGLRVRSMLSAAIYRKQLRLSNSAKINHSAGEIMNYVNVDAYRIGEFSYWFHQTWTTSLQLCIALLILIRFVGLATIAALAAIILTVICNAPLAKLQHKFQKKLMVAQDARLKATLEALVNMKVLNLYAWESHFKNVIEKMRKDEYKLLSAVQLQKAYNIILFWSSPILISATTFGTCYFIGIPLYARNVFTFIATLRLAQDPVRTIPDVIGVVIQAKVALVRIAKFLEAPELQNRNVKQKFNVNENKYAIYINSSNLSWEKNPSKPTLKNINLEVKQSEKVAICGEVGSGKSTLLAAILGEVPNIEGMVQVCGKIAYVSQTAWIQTGSIQENILFGSSMNRQRYQDTLEKCSLVKDLQMLPFGDHTEIGERGVNLSGGQKQRIQLARALYQDADIFLLDDPFSAVDAQTATSLFNEYVKLALEKKTVILVTHQVDFLLAFDSILLMSEGRIIDAAPYQLLLSTSQEFRDLVNAHKETAGSERLNGVTSLHQLKTSTREIISTCVEKQIKTSVGNQLIQQEERDKGNTGVKPYLQYLNQNMGYLYLFLATLSHTAFVVGQILQNSWMAANVQNPHVSKLRLIIVYLVIGCSSILFLLLRSLLVVGLGIQSSKSLFTQIVNSLFRAPISFYDSTPLGRIINRVSLDLSIIDLDVPITLMLTVGSTLNTFANLGVLAILTWQVLFICMPILYLVLRLQNYYFSSAKDLMRINGTTKSLIANHLAESIAGAVTIRAFEEEDRFFAKNLNLIDTNASPFFHTFSANEWLIQRLEMLSAAILASSTLAMALLPPGTIGSGFIGMALSYGLPLNIALAYSVQSQCVLANYIVSMERLNQYMHIPSEAPEIIEDNQPVHSWPSVGRVEIQSLKIRYRSDTPLVLQGISCTFQGGHKIGIVGRTGSGKTTLISALFRLVEPTEGKIIVDGLDIATIGLHDLRSRFGIIPQDPTLFNGTVRYNLDPLSQHTDNEIWEVLEKCQLRETVEEKEKALDSLVLKDGSNWSVGQRQLFCLGRALLRSSRILVLDEATASIDNATDTILQKTIRTEFADCTVITVAHRIPTVMDCTMVLAISDGKLVEYDEPMKLMNTEGSLFRQLVNEYWSQIHSANSQQNEM